MRQFILDLDSLREAITEVLRKLLHQVLPPLIEQATRKPYLTRTEVKELTGWSDRHLQYLRDSRQIEFVQHGRTIVYPTKEFYAFLDAHRIVLRSSSQGER